MAPKLEVFEVMAPVEKQFRNDKNQLHNLDGPALVLENGRQSWFVDGFRHNPNGPAIIAADGRKIYYLFGRRFDDIAEFNFCVKHLHCLIIKYEDIEFKHSVKFHDEKIQMEYKLRFN